MGCKKRDKFEAIHSLKTEHPINLLCAIAGVSRAGYYRWLLSQTNSKDDDLKEILGFEHKRLRGIYGYRRMKILLKRKYSLKVNHKRIYRLMKQLHLQAVIRRKSPYRTFTYVRHTVAPNILERNFNADQPNQKWVTDITYLNVFGKQYFLSAILDLFNNEVVSYRLSRNLKVDFVVDTVKAALATHPTLDNLVLHSDQGMHYTSRVYGKVLRENGILQSMSRKGNCLDNACIECFFGHLKSELRPEELTVDFHGLLKEIDTYIKFYNEERHQSRLADMSPVEFRNYQLQTA